MSRLNLEKMDRLHKYRRDLEETAKECKADLHINSATTTRLEVSLSQLNITSNPGEADSLNKQILELRETQAKFQRRHFKISDDLQATIGLINACEEWLIARGISVPPDNQSRRSFSYYNR